MWLKIWRVWVDGENLRKFWQSIDFDICSMLTKYFLIHKTTWLWAYWFPLSALLLLTAIFISGGKSLGSVIKRFLNSGDVINVRRSGFVVDEGDSKVLSQFE